MVSFWHNLGRIPKVASSDDESAAGWDDDPIPEDKSHITTADGIGVVSETTESPLADQPLICLDFQEPEPPIHEHGSSDTFGILPSKPSDGPFDVLPIPDTPAEMCGITQHLVGFIPQPFGDYPGLSSEIDSSTHGTASSEAPRSTEMIQDGTNDFDNEEQSQAKNLMSAAMTEGADLVETTEVTLEEEIKDPFLFFVGIFDAFGDVALIAGPELTAFRVCSRTLARYSPVWRDCLFEESVEGKAPQRKSKWKFYLPDDHPEALRVILHAVHGNFGSVKKEVTYEMLFNLTVIADRYEMFSPLRSFWRGWSMAELPPITDPFSRIQRLWVAYQLGDLASYGREFSGFVNSLCAYPHGGLYFDGWEEHDLHNDQYLKRMDNLLTLGVVRRATIRTISSQVTNDLDARLQCSIPDTAPKCRSSVSRSEWKQTCDSIMLGALQRAMVAYGVEDWFTSKLRCLEDTLAISIVELLEHLEDIKKKTYELSGEWADPEGRHRYCGIWEGLLFEGAPDTLSTVVYDEWHFISRANETGFNS